jgi:hypothetical protein
VHSKAVVEDLELKADTKFVVATTNAGVTMVGLEENGSIRPVAKVLSQTAFKAGKKYRVDAEFSDASGQLAVYIYGGTEMK